MDLYVDFIAFVESVNMLNHVSMVFAFVTYTKCEERHYFHQKKACLSVSVKAQKLPIRFS